MPTPAAPAPPVATSVDSSAESATTALYRAAIGPISNDYYLPIFTRFEAADQAGLSWNTAASLYTVSWMVFRHLWKAAGIYIATLLGAALLVLAAVFVLRLSDEAEWSLWLALAVLSYVVPGLFGNALLHSASRKNMALALSASGTLRDACALLNQQASSRQRFIWLAVANLVLAGVVAGAYVVVTQFGSILQSKTTMGIESRQTMGRLSETPAQNAPVSVPVAVASAAPAASSVAAPAPMASAPASAPLPPALAASVSPVAVVSPTTPPPVQDQAQLDAMAATMSRNVTRRPVLPAPKTEAQIYHDAMATSMTRYVTRRPVITETPTEAPTPPLPAPAASPPAPVQKTSAAKVKDKPKAAATTAAKHYAINVGLFANNTNARNTHTKLRDAGLPASLQELETAKGERTRVRVGPFNSRAEAEAAAKKIRSLQLEAVIVQPS